MVPRVFGFLQKEITSIHVAAFVLGGAALASQLLALVRDKLLAYQFGASATLDLYYAAFRIPDAIFATVASLVSLSVLIPFLSEAIAKGNEEARKYIDQVFTLFMILITVVIGVAWLVVPQINTLLFPDITAAYAAELALLARILLLSPLFLGISNLCASITQTHSRFAMYAASPILYNLGIIGGIVFLYPTFGIQGLAYGVVIGTILHMAIQLPFLIQNGLLPRLTKSISFSRIRDMVTISLPRTLTISAAELAELVLVSLASLFTVGSVTIFTFAWNLQSVPLSIIGVSYSLAVFPTLTQLFTKGSMPEFTERLSTAARHIIFWSVPITTIVIILRAHIVRIVLGAGAFQWTETRLTAAALALFAVSLVPQGLSMLFVRAHYARGKTQVPLIINASTSIIIVVLGVGITTLLPTMPAIQAVIERLFRVTDVQGTDVLVLPLVYTIGMYLNVIVHWIYTTRALPTFGKPVLRTIGNGIASAVIGSFATYTMLAAFGPVVDLRTVIGVALHGTVAGIVGLGVTLAVLTALKSEELAATWTTFKTKIKRTPVIAPDPTLQ